MNKISRNMAAPHGRRHAVVNSEQTSVDSILILRDLRYQPEPLHMSSMFSDGFSFDENVEHIGDKDSEKYKLDLYIPKFKGLRIRASRHVTGRQSTAKKQPVVVFVHGGGWRRGDRCAWKHYLSARDTNILMAVLLKVLGLYGNIGEALAQRGVVCAVISYPLSRLGIPWLFVEMATSYLMSALFLLTTSGILAFMLKITGQIFDISRNKDELFTQGCSTDGTKLLLLSLTVVNVIIAIMMTMFKRLYRLTWLNILSLWTIIIVSLLHYLTRNQSQTLNYGADENYFRTLILFLSTLSTTQGAMFYKHCQLPTVNYTHQLQAVRDAVVFVKKYGTHSQLFDPHHLYLMGHSAGGHLVTMFTLHTYLHTIPQYSVKGVISISGVFDLLKLDNWCLKPLYLEPAFGSQRSDWTQASPIHLFSSSTETGCGRTITKGPDTERPRFLLIIAEQDLHLHDDANELREKISQLGAECTVRTVCPSNHFTIVWDFKSNRSADNTKLSQMCLEFIHGKHTRLDYAQP